MSSPSLVPVDTGAITSPGTLSVEELSLLKRKAPRVLKLLLDIRGKSSDAQIAQPEPAESIDTGDYVALAREASEFPPETTNEVRTQWLNEKLGLSVILTGELSCPTLMAPIGPEGDAARERFHGFASEYIRIMQEKNPNLKLPPYNKKAHTPKVSQEAHVTHEKLETYFSTTFFTITAGQKELQKLVDEYEKIPMNEGNNCRDRALWILRKTGQSIFYKPDGTLDRAENGVPNTESVPRWDKQTGFRLDGGFFVGSNWLFLSGVRVGHCVWRACFVRNGANCDLRRAGCARVPVLAVTSRV